MQHHEIFSHFQGFHGEVPAFCQADFVGTKIRREFVADLAVSSRPVFESIGSPSVDEEYFEWIDLLESVVAARDCYTMIELGAGFGRWAVRAACAARQFNPSLSYHVTAVEAEPAVFEWMQLHFSDNGVQTEHRTAVHGAVSETDQDVLFYVGGPRGGSLDTRPDHWYGQCLTHREDVASVPEFDGYYKGFPAVRHSSGWRSIRVPAIRLSNLLKDREKVDLVDMDIEGQELAVIRSTIKALNAKVKRVHVGTHSKEIESDLRYLFAAHGWSCLADYSLFSESDTPWGRIRFENGVQSWVNPRL